MNSGTIPGPRPIAWTFSDRSGGVSAGPYRALNLADHVGDEAAAVRANRARFGARLGVVPSELAVLAAAHGADALVVDAGGTARGVDIVVTTTPGLGLMALAADCVPLALGDPVAGVAAVVHSGWRGVAADTVGSAVRTMVGVGADPASITAVLGPRACPRCYEVSSEVVDALVAVSDAGAATTTRTGTPSVDLHAAITVQLRHAGVSDVLVDDRCTLEDPELFSYRRDRVTGRQGVLAVLTGPGS